jgi:membrane protease subunit (stomatin/prohibitin family)
MSLWNRLKGELVDVIEWLNNSNDILCYRFPRYRNEIKYGARLTVREGQAAVFINQGQIADVFTPGMYTLETRNLPVLSTLMGWKHGFQSPFKAEVYFVSTRRFTDQKWGTRNPIMLRDPEFGPIRLRAFGTYVIRVSDPAVFIREIVGTDGHFTTDAITGQLRNIVVSRFADALGEAKIPALDLAANYDELALKIKERIQGEFGKYGMELTKLLVENVSLPPNVEAALDKRSSMGIIGDMRTFTQYQTAEAIREAANNPGDSGSMAAGGMGIGAGFAMGSHMLHSLNQGNVPAPGTPGSPGTPGTPGGPGAAPPPLVQFFTAVNGAQAGPFDLGALAGQVHGGQVTRDTMVWKAGMANWTPAGQVPELSSLFAAPPPPPPPPPAAPPPPPPAPPTN